MWNQRAVGGLKTSLGVLGLLVCATTAPGEALEAGAGQAQALAETATGIVTCALHPCLGDSEQEVRKELDNKVVFDGVVHLSDLTTAFPPAKKILSGVVEWEFESNLEAVSLRLTDFQPGPEVFLAELERLLPGCEMEQEDDAVEHGPGDEQENAGDPTRTWSCSARGHGSDEVPVEVFFVPGLLILEIGS